MNGDDPRPAPSGQWQFRPDETPPQTVAQQPGPGQASVVGTQPSMLYADEYLPPTNSPAPVEIVDETVSWTASEFIAHNKSAGWYGMLVLVTALLALMVFFITRDRISASAIVLTAFIFGLYAARKPRTLAYKIDHSGLTIAQKFYTYNQFRSFAPVTEDAFAGIVFMPLRRFMPPITVYYDPKDEQRIMHTLSDRLPMETHRLDPVDQFLRRIRF